MCAPFLIFFLKQRHFIDRKNPTAVACWDGAAAAAGRRHLGLVLAGIEKHFADAGVACRAAMGFAWTAYGGLESFGDFVVADAAFHCGGCWGGVIVVVVVGVGSVVIAGRLVVWW